MDQNTAPEVERAFREWCAMVGVPSAGAGEPGGYGLRRDDLGRFRIEQVGGQGGGDEARVVGVAMTGAALCDAVRFLHDSLHIKTIQVARAVARKKARRP